MIVRAAPVDPPPTKITVANKPKNWSEIVLPAVKDTIKSLLKLDAATAGDTIEPGIGVVPFSIRREPASSETVVLI